MTQEIGKISAVALISFMEKKPSDLRKIKRVAMRRNTGGVNDSCFAFFICLYHICCTVVLCWIFMTIIIMVVKKKKKLSCALCCINSYTGCLEWPVGYI